MKHAVPPPCRRSRYPAGLAGAASAGTGQSGTFVPDAATEDSTLQGTFG